jgi:hypothetical protein
MFYTLVADIWQDTHFALWVADQPDLYRDMLLEFLMIIKFLQYFPVLNSVYNLYQEYLHIFLSIRIPVYLSKFLFPHRKPLNFPTIFSYGVYAM